jgi:hypothetical protein
MGKTLSVSREKHLDHMLRVVPFIVLGYALQCYVISQIDAESFATDSLIFLGLGLCLMIASFVIYDLQHKVTLNQTQIEITFNLIGMKKHILLNEIVRIEIGDPEQNFSNIIIHQKNGTKTHIFFVDNAAGIKKWIEEHQSGTQQLAA